MGHRVKLYPLPKDNNSMLVYYCCYYYYYVILNHKEFLRRIIFQELIFSVSSSGPHPHPGPLSVLHRSSSSPCTPQFLPRSPFVLHGSSYFSVLLLSPSVFHGSSSSSPPDLSEWRAEERVSIYIIYWLLFLNAQSQCIHN